MAMTAAERAAAAAYNQQQVNKFANAYKSNNGFTSNGTVGGNVVSTGKTGGTPAPAPAVAARPNVAPSFTPSSAPSNANLGAMNQLVYYKQAYENAQKAGKDPSSLKYITDQAKGAYGQMDQSTQTQLKGMNAAQAAAYYRQLSGKDNQNSLAGVSGGAAAPEVMQPEGPSEYDQMMEMLKGYMQNYDSQMAGYQQQMADFQRQQQEAMKGQYESLINQYGQAQNADLEALDRDYAQAQAQLEDDSFQQYLNARQTMANRGLAGSGLANDQDTRLLMANSKNLAGLQNSVLNQKSGVKLRYGSQIDGLKNQLASMTGIPSAAGGGVASRYNQSGGPYAPDSTTLNMMFDIFKETLPYNRATVKDQMGYDVDLRKVQHDYDKLSSEEQRFYDKLGVDSQLKVAELAQKNDLELTKIFGYDKNGNVTLDAKYKNAVLDQGQQKIDIDSAYKGGLLNQGQQKIDIDSAYKGGLLNQGQQKIDISAFKTQNQVAQDWQKVQIQQQNADTAVGRLQLNADMFENQQNKETYEQQAKAATTLLNSSYTAMSNAYTALLKNPDDENLKAQYAKSKKEYDIAFQAVDELAELDLSKGVKEQSKTSTQKKVDSFFDGIGKLLGGVGSAVSDYTIGGLSRKYESSGNAGTVARTKGDIGGASYGMYQMATSQGTPKRFAEYLKKADPSAHKALAGKTPGTPAFDSAWKTLAKNNPKFGNYQHEFIQQQYYTPAVSSLKKSGIDVNSRSKAVKDAVWSTAVQHGTGSVSKIFKSAGITSKMSDAQIIERLYKERGADGGMKYFSSSSPDVRAGVVSRFKSEMADALKMLS